MPHVVIRCPRTGSNVQVWVSEGRSVPNTDEYEGVTCLACMQVHFVHKISGKLLGQQGFNSPSGISYTFYDPIYDAMEIDPPAAEDQG